MAHTISRRDFLRLSGASCAAALAPSILAGCARPKVDDNVIKVGVMGPYSGEVAQYGLAVRSGVELFVKQLNAAGGINGKRIELDIQDEKGDATEAVNVYYKMVEDGVVAIIGDVTSTPSIAVAQASLRDNMPLVSGSATAPDLIKYGHNTFRACITDPFQGRVMADFAAKQGYKVVGTIYNSGGDYEVGVNDAFVRRAQEKGIQISRQEGYAAGDVDFKAQLTSIIATKPDAILSPNYYQDDGKIVTQARELGFKGAFLGADGWANIVGGEQEYASAADLEGCFYDSSFVSANDAANVQDFIRAFNDEFHEQPTNFCALGYDAAMIMFAAIRRVEEGGARPSETDAYRAGIIDAIATGHVEGVTGAISFEGTGDPVKSTLIITFENGVEKIYDTISS